MKNLSIIIVSYNTRDILKNCLDSIFNNYIAGDYEVVLVDNNSQDGSQEMVAELFPQVCIIVNDTNRGFAAANNQGMAIAQGKYVLLLNSDTVIIKDVIEKSLDYMEMSAQVGMMGCRVLNADGSMQETCFMWPSLLNIALYASGMGMFFPHSVFFKRERLKGWLRDSEREVEAITGCYLLVRKDAIDKVGMLDEDFFFYGEETDWCRRFRECGYKVMFAPVGEIIHLGGASGDVQHYSRKIMRAQAIIRLQRKHNGIVCAMLAWLLLCGEALCKGCGYGLMALKNKNKYFPVARKNLAAFRHFAQAWVGRCHTKRKKIFAVASSGGHWVQLQLLSDLFADYETVYLSTQADLRERVIGNKFYTIRDVSRWEKRKIPAALLQMLWFVFKERPEVIITTGALPGLVAIICGKICRVRTVWIDSIANCEELSLSGKLARHFADLWLTQWEHIAQQIAGLEYAGKVLQ